MDDFIWSDLFLIYSKERAFKCHVLFVGDGSSTGRDSIDSDTRRGRGMVLKFKKERPNTANLDAPSEAWKSENQGK